MSSSTGAAIVIDGVTKSFRIDAHRPDSLKGGFTSVLRRHKREDFLALDDVSFAVQPGSICGLIGANGSGKSTLLKCIAGILVPDIGEITVQGRIASLLELGAGFHNDLTGRENVYLNGSLLGLSKREIEERFDEIVSWSELERFIDNPIKTYSSGMRVRLGFAIATTVDADVLLLDEVLQVGDMNFRKKSRERMDRLLYSGCTIVIVTHDLTTLSSLCDMGVALDHGRVADAGPINDVIESYETLMNADVPDARPVEPELVHGTLLATELVGLGDEPVDGRHWTEPLLLRVQLDAGRCAGDPHLILGIRNSEGVIVSHGVMVGVLDAMPSEGIAEIDIEIPPMPLADGSYEFTIVIRDLAAGATVDRLLGVSPFVLESRPARKSRGVIPLEAACISRTLVLDPLDPGDQPSQTSATSDSSRVANALNE